MSNTINSSTSNVGSTSAPARPAPAAPPPPPAAPAPTTTVRTYGNAADLNRSPANTSSNPAASMSVTRAQNGAASEMGGPRAEGRSYLTERNFDTSGWADAPPAATLAGATAGTFLRGSVEVNQVNAVDAPAAPAGPAAPADPNAPADFTDRLGSLDYYRDRAEDFRRRNPGMEPPDYYMDYGDKYARRFTNELAPKLSPEGQQWLATARRNLQVAIENRRQQDPAAFAELERNPDAFRAFAYATHADAYLDAGLRNLSPIEMAQVGLTPDAKDLLTRDGVSQVWEVGTRLAGQYARSAGEWIDRTTQPLQDAVRPVTDAVRDGAQWVGEQAAPVVEAVRDGANWVAEQARPVTDAVRDGANWVADQARPVTDAVRDGAQWVGDRAGEALQAAMPALEVTRQVVQSGVDTVARGVNAAGEAINAGTSWVADQASGAWNTVSGWFSW